jgi:hypothetical protein
MRTIMTAIAIAALLASSPASAYRGSRHAATIRLGTISHEAPNARVINVRPEPGAEDRIRKWEEFCRPVGLVDSLGVTRYMYAEYGCEFGRSE